MEDKGINLESCPNVEVVGSLREVLDREFTKKVNCYVFPRVDIPDFSGVFDFLDKYARDRYPLLSDGIQYMFDPELIKDIVVPTSFESSISAARRLFLNDLEILKQTGGSPMPLYDAFSSAAKPAAAHEPHYDNGENLLFNYGPTPTMTAHPDDIIREEEGLGFLLAEDARLFSLGVGSVARFAGLEDAKNGIDPFAHWGTTALQRIVMQRG